MCIKIDKILYVAFFTPNTPNERVAQYKIKNSFFFQKHPTGHVLDVAMRGPICM